MVSISMIGGDRMCRNERKTKIIYEDNGILVCRKPAGLAVQTAAGYQSDMVSELKNYLSRMTGEKNPYLGVVHRLDQPVEGLLVFARSKRAAASLSKQLTEGRLNKKYLAVLARIPEEMEGQRVDYLKKDSRTNRALVVPERDQEGKRAELFYRVVEEREPYALAEIEIRTGRFHQIRVQMAHMGCPLSGDRKYGKTEDGSEKGIIGHQGIGLTDSGLALCANELSFENPLTGKRQQFAVRPENAAFARFTYKMMETAGY